MLKPSRLPTRFLSWSEKSHEPPAQRSRLDFTARMNRDAPVIGAELQAYLRQVLPLYAYIGLTVESCVNVFECSVPLNEHNRNHFGGMHAAVLWAAAEVLGGIVYFAHQAEFGDCWGAAQEVSISFLKPAMTDVRARASFDEVQAAQVKAQMDARGKAGFVLDIELLDAVNTVVAKARGKYYFRRTGSSPPGSAASGA